MKFDEVLPPAGKICARAWCDGQGGGHAEYAVYLIVFDRPLLWGWGAKKPRKDVNACARCKDALIQCGERRGAVLVRVEDVKVLRG